MSAFSRRQFLAFIGGASATATMGALLPRAAWAAPVPLSFTPVRLPHPLGIYTTNGSFLATGLNGAGIPSPASATAELPAYTVIDDVIVPPEFERYVLAQWGDRPFIDPNQYVGYNHDWTGYVPLSGTNDGLLFINHEYVSYPISRVAPGTNPGFNTPTGLESFGAVIGFPLPTDGSGVAVINRETQGEFFYNVGGSVLRIRRVTRGGRFAVVARDSLNRRIHGLSGLGVNASRTDGYASVTSWGARPHQQGDLNWLVGTGPAVADVFEGVNTDGLGNKIIGTIANCSGGMTPWGTFLTAEENYQGSSFFFSGVTEGVKPNGAQTGYIASTSGIEFGMVGEKYGYMVEIDARSAGNRARKHTALGRFRHENIAVRAAPGAPLIAYSGDDRRGGHTWKFVSDGTIGALTSPENSRLFEQGTLYVARFNPDGATDAIGMSISGTGTWIPLRMDTECAPIDPDLLAEVQALNQLSETAQITGRLNLPARPNLAGSSGTVTGGFFNLNRSNKNTINPNTGQTYFDDYRQFPDGTTKRLSDFYDSLGAILVDAYGAGGLVGGTPCARPEDIEVQPRTKEVFIAMTDGAPSSDGYPDSRVFVNAKYSADINATQQSGGIYKIIEGSADGSGLTFQWERFSQSGEDGAIDGDGYANVDNLVFDANMNLWGVTDMSTGLHNAIGAGPTPTQLVVNHEVVGSAAAETLVGAYGNNWLFYIPTEGPNAGELYPFAIGPTRSEMTGPTFIGDTLILAVQHPGEDSPTGNAVSNFVSNVQMLNLAGSATFNQTRNAPTGSNWPSNIAGNASGFPRPTTIGIRRKAGGSFV